MKKSIELLLDKLEARHIARHVVCPSADYIIHNISCCIPDPIEIIDERSAGYVATGMSEEINEPVVIWCANNDSYRNLAPSLTEAYYRKTPILVVALSNGSDIDQTVNPNDIIRYYVNHATIDFINAESKIVAAIDHLYADVKGPVFLPIGLSDSIPLRSNNVVDTRKHIDVTPLISILPPDACVHVGKNISCECKHIKNLIFRDNHCTKDGNVSMLIGSSLVAQKQLHVGIFTFEEVAYDLNMLGNRHIGNNIVIISLKQKNQSSSIYKFANRMSWDCKLVSLEELFILKKSFVISEQPQYIEVTL